MEALLKQLLAGQEKILATLAEHSETLQKHTEILQQHSEMLQQHGEILQQHSEMLQQHGEILQQHSEMLQQHGEMLNQHGNRLDTLESRLLNISNNIEHDLMPKINALFDAFELRGDQITKLQQHLDKRLDAITLDVNYLLGKTARQETALMELKRAR